jgi:hypothetical protein
VRRGAARLLLLAFGACAPSPEPQRETRAEIVHGAVDDGDPAVVALVAPALRCTTEPAPTLCTGTLIAPRVVLTAAHCLANRRAGELRVAFGPDARSPTRLVDVDRARVHPSYDAGTGLWDVALLQLSVAQTETPATLPRARLAPNDVGRAVRLAGYGLDDAALSGRKRQGGATLSQVALAGDAAEPAIIRYVPGPAMSCGGDSGGPVFFDDGAGEVLIGVTRSGDAACAQFGAAVQTADLIDDFVRPFVDQAAAAPARPRFDRGADECASTCASDDDCPTAMACLNERAAGFRCGFSSLQSGRLGAACARDEDCAGGACIGVDDGCRCFRPCDAGADAGAQPALELVGGGGCSVVDARTTSRAGAALVAFVVFAVFTVRRRNERRSRVSG